jgi:hypothetical protein
LTTATTLLVIGIPVHGSSPELTRSLKAIHQSLQFLDLNHVHLIIANSLRRVPVLLQSHFPRYTELLLDECSYWTGSVSAIYREFIKSAYRSPFLLLNHDCIPAPDCIYNLLEQSKNHRLYALHAQLNYFDQPKRVWWSGSRIGFFGTRKLTPSSSDHANSLLIASSSAMGQCLLIHPDLVDPSLLCESLLPHYFADSVQTTLMRRKGAVVAVLRTALAFTDQSDYTKKINRWYSGPSSSFIPRVLFSPWSNRLITARLFATYLEIDNKAQALLSSFLVFFATILVTLRDYVFLLLKGSV